jgi:two-component sensor histidine kinase
MKPRIKFNLFNSFLKTGVEKNYSKELSQSIIFVNYFALQTSIVLISGIIMGYFYGVFYTTWTSLLFAFISALSVLLNRKKLHITAGYLLLVSVNIAQFYFCLMFGKACGTYLYYFPILMGIGLIFSAKIFIRHQYVLSIITLAFGLVAFLFGDDIGVIVKLSSAKSETLFKHNFIVALILSLVSSFFAVRMNQLRITLQDRVIEQKLNTEKNSTIALKENKVLLAEIHHRVKNNLAIMRSLIRLQITNINDAKLEPYLNDLLNRIDSMSYVHEKLYRNNNFSFIQGKDFLKQIANNIINSFDYRQEIQFNFDCDTCVLNLNDAIPLALITNEAITNSMKYAFQKEKEPKIITFTLKQNKDRSLFVTINDNGVGFDLENIDNDSSSSLGIFLIRSLSEQLDGTVEFYNDNGAVTHCHLFVSRLHSMSEDNSHALTSTPFVA